MDKYTFNIKADKITKAVNRGDYNTAVKVADTVEWTGVDNLRLLSTVATAYEKTGHYDEAIDILLEAYEAAPSGRRFLGKLVELSIANNSLEDAEQYLALGADRLGTSRIVKIVKAREAEEKA